MSFMDYILQVSQISESVLLSFQAAITTLEDIKIKS